MDFAGQNSELSLGSSGERERLAEITPRAACAISIRIAEKSYGEGARLCVMENVALDVGHGEFIAFLGPSGCGKTTLLRMIAGLDTDYSGRIEAHGAPVTRPSSKRGIVFQESRLLPWYTVEQNLAFALPAIAKQDYGLTRVRELLNLVGLNDFRSVWPRQLSGGMEKRVALARALVTTPEVLLLDEPFGALDMMTKYGLQKELVRLHSTLALTTILVTHDVEDAAYLADRVVVLTKRPATVANVVPIELPRPRDRTTFPFENVRVQLLKAVLSQVNGSTL